MTLVEIGSDITLDSGRTGFVIVGDSTPSRIEIVDILSTRGVLLRTLSDTTGVIYVGYKDSVDTGLNPTTSGFPIEPGEGLHIAQDRASRFYLISDTADQKVFWAIL